MLSTMPGSKDPLKKFFGSRTEEMLVHHVLQEVGKGRDLQDILKDPYITNRTSELERRALLDNTDVVRAVGDDAAARIRSQMGT
jgi:hypothetical protein